MIEKLESFLIRKKIEKNNESSLFGLAYEFWEKIQQHFHNKEMIIFQPNVIVGDFNTINNSSIVFVWSLDRHYLDCEFSSENDVSFFYRDRITGNNCLYEFGIEERIPKELENHLLNFIKV